MQACDRATAVGQQEQHLDIKMPETPAEAQRYFDDKIAKNANRRVKDYLSGRVPVFRQLNELMEQGWQNLAGDQFFKNQRKRPDNHDRQPN
ncbi:putative urea active transporter [Rosellinia necatrix]|uniref:Putative urea active transporter n=1 Tax=Rosellinia necatrix TaxID=77044 RepID=A0A1S8A6V0_ROSNE|nr:putative urea active transporter [Rosellinia necatrix]